MRFLIFCAVFGLFYWLSLVIVAEEADTRSAVYCAAVEAHEATSGQYGWPAYKGPCGPEAR